MIKPLDNSVMFSKQVTFNALSCALPTVYENVQDTQPTGKKLNIFCDGCTKPKGLGEKLDRIV